MGGWTDRIDVEFKNNFQSHDLLLKRGWIEVLLWSSNPDASRETVELTVELAIHRAAYTLQRQRQQQHSLSATSLGDMLSQEAWVWKRYNKNHGQPTIQNEICKDTLPPYLEVSRKYADLRIDEDFPTISAAFYGDNAASARGYPSVGTSGWSGTEICKHELRNIFDDGETSGDS